MLQYLKNVPNSQKAHPLKVLMKYIKLFIQFCVTFLRRISRALPTWAPNPIIYIQLFVNKHGYNYYWQIDNIKTAMYQVRLTHLGEHRTCNPKAKRSIPDPDHANQHSQLHFTICFITSWCHYVIENATPRLFIYLHVIFETVKNSPFNNF